MSTRSGRLRARRSLQSLVAVSGLLGVAMVGGVAGSSSAVASSDATSARDQGRVQDSATSTAFAGLLPDGLLGIPLAGWRPGSNVFSVDISDAPVNANSAGIVANLATQVSSVYGGVAAFNVWNYNVSFTTALPTTPRQQVIWDNCQKKKYVPAQLYSDAQGGVFNNVPIPSGAVPAAGTDGELTIWDPVNDQLWELWKAKQQADGWHACWGGRIDHWSSSPGIFPNGTGTSASGLAVAAGAITVSEASSGVINHALSLGVRSAANWKTFSYPAQSSDGGEAFGSPNAVPEGMRFRLDPSLDLSTLKLTPIALAVAKAAQKYGFIVTDKGGAVSVHTENGAATAAVTGVNPWTAMMKSTPSYKVMANFPWSRLQALPFDYGKPAASATSLK